MPRHCHTRSDTARTSTVPRKTRAPDVDVVIAGASFAGLAVACALRGHDVTVIDPDPVGAFETSAGGAPYVALQALGLAGSARELHHQLVLHTRRAERIVRLPSPYAVIDYGLFCRGLVDEAGAHVLRRRATAYRDGTVITDRGAITCRAAADASGQGAVLASSVQPGYALRA